MNRDSFKTSVSKKEQPLVMFTPTKKFTAESSLMFGGLSEAQRRYSLQKISKSAVNLNKFD